MNKYLYKFLRKLFILSIPIDIAIVCYLILDPFKTTWQYERYFFDNTAHVGLNMDFVSTENFVNRNPIQKYNAFIFGNSRSQYWQVDDWQEYIGKEARCYHFYGNGESLYNMAHNIQFIHHSGNDIDYALFVIDAELLRQAEVKPGHLFCTPPRTIGYRNIIKFHTSNFLAFLHPLFVYACVDYQLHKTLKTYMLEKYLFEQPIVYNPNSNEIADQLFDQAIADGTYYNAKRMHRFQDIQHPDSISPSILLKENKRLLREIAHILHQHHTKYKIVISPVYDQIRINPADIQVLQDIFGKSNVYDFSGKNPITSDYHNYYEESHYRPIIARQLMDSLYLQIVN